VERYRDEEVEVDRHYWDEEVDKYWDKKVERQY
jgi:hypothetical protein